jgi:hypothetical protein
MRIHYPFFAATFLLVTGGSFALDRPIDLDAPGVLERMKETEPKRFEVVTEALRVAAKTPCRKAEVEMLKTRFDIDGLNCTPILQTSNPPKRRVVFSLKDTHYVAVVVVDDINQKLVPLKAPE